MVTWIPFSCNSHCSLPVPTEMFPKLHGFLDTSNSLASRTFLSLLVIDPYPSPAYKVPLGLALKPTLALPHTTVLTVCPAQLSAVLDGSCVSPPLPQVFSQLGELCPSLSIHLAPTPPPALSANATSLTPRKSYPLFYPLATWHFSLPCHLAPF